jgi:DNA-binding XRE family transcriptional regulator
MTISEQLAPLWTNARCAGCDDMHLLPPNSDYCGNCLDPNIQVKATRAFGRCLLSRGLRRERKRLGMSQQDLAKVSGITRISIGAFETGRRLAKTSTAMRLAWALGVDLEDIEG